MIAEFIRKLLTGGYRQEEIAEKTGLKQSYISRLSRGANCSLETTIKFAEVFGVSVDEVLGREKPKPLSRKQEVLLKIVNEDEKLLDSVIKHAEMEKYYDMKQRGAA